MHEFIPQCPPLFETSLAFPFAPNDTSFTIASDIMINGVPLVGLVCLSIDIGQPNPEYVVGTLLANTVTVLLRNVNPLNPTVAGPMPLQEHRRGADVKITDFASIEIMRNLLSGVQTLDNILLYTQPQNFVDPLSLIDKQYVDGIISTGITPPNAGTPVNGNTGALQSSGETISVTTQGNERFLIAKFSMQTAATITSMTYNGVAMTLLGVQGLNDVRVEVWGLVNPSAGTHDLIMTTSAPTLMEWDIVPWDQVDQTTPYTAGTSTSGTGILATGSVTTLTSYSIVVQNVATELIGTIYTPGTGQSIISSNISGSIQGAMEVVIAANPATITSNLNISGSTDWVSVTGSINGITNSTKDYYIDTGTVNTIVITPVPALGSYVIGQHFFIKVADTNTGATTINANGLGAIPLVKEATVPLNAGDILAGEVILVIYDGTNFQLISGGSGSGGGGGIVTRSAISSFALSPASTVSIDTQGTSGANAGNVMTGTGSIQNLYINSSNNTLNGNTVYTLLKNGTPTSITVTVPAGTNGIFSNTIDSFAVAGGDILALRCDTTGSSAGAGDIAFSYQVGNAAKVVDVQTFTTSGIWTKPAGAKSIQVIAVGGGGGGGGGSLSSGLAGGGGAGGAFNEKFFDASIAGATETVTVGDGGAGGLGSVGATPGTNGASGGNSSFGSKLIANGGGAGLLAGTSSAGGQNGGLEDYGGNGGAKNLPGSNALSGAGGGGGGDGSHSTGGAGGGAGTQTGTGGGGAGGIFTSSTPPIDGDDYTTLGTAYTGSGGGGGYGGNDGITVGTSAGANGGLYGGGGGGGGGGVNTGGANSSNGGNGAPGVVVVITIF